MPNTALRDYKKMPEESFPVDIFERRFSGPGPIFKQHWHEHLQFIYFTEGEAFITCNSRSFTVGPEDLAVINGNELHNGESLGAEVVCYMIRIDFSFLLSHQVDSCQIKYIAPLIENKMAFKNCVSRDQAVITCVQRMITEYFQRRIGYELAIKAQAYELLVLLLRGYLDKVYNEREYKNIVKNVQRFQQVLEFMEDHYVENISVDQLAAMANISKYHFCRLFKQLTGKSAGDCLNQLRINHALTLLRESDQNITEIALASGFNDSNYFSRAFKNSQHISPSQFRKDKTVKATQT